jgi:chromobox protein 1
MMANIWWKKIIKRRVNKKGGVEYLIRWKNFEPKWDTWEPKSHLDCPEKIAAFEAAHGPKKGNHALNSSLSVSNTSLVTDPRLNTSSNGSPATSSSSSAQVEGQSGVNGNSHSYVEEEEEEEEKELKGFARGLKPEKITGSCRYEGNTYFCVKWRRSDIKDLVTEEEAVSRCPQLVIKHYEQRLTLAPGATSMDSDSD